MKFRFWISVVGLGLLTGCGGGSTSPTSPSTPVPRTIAQGNFSIDAPSPDHVHFVLVNVTDPASGTWQATVDWTYATNEIWMYVSAGACTADQFALPACPDQASCPCTFTLRSEAATPKPRVLTISGAQGGTRTLFVVNWGPREDGGVYQVTLTPTASLTGLGASEQLGGGRAVVGSGLKSRADFSGSR